MFRGFPQSTFELSTVQILVLSAELCNEGENASSRGSCDISEMRWIKDVQEILGCIHKFPD
jgi:hypothetical protein